MLSLSDLQYKMRSNASVLKTAYDYQSLLPIMWKHRGQRHVIQRGDDILIEGYFRCANTFAVESFAKCQNRPVKIGHHFHSPGQFELARRYKVPAMLLIREPIAAALSYVVFKDGAWSPHRALKFYVEFHRPLPAIAESFVVAPFEEVTHRYDLTIQRLNDRFGTQFVPFEHNEDAEKAIFEGIDTRMKQRGAEIGVDMDLRMNFPNERKAQRRSEIQHMFEDADLDGLKAEATDLYEGLMAQI